MSILANVHPFKIFPRISTKTEIDDNSDTFATKTNKEAIKI